MKLPAGHVPGVGVVKASAYGGFGQKMMQQMGWEKGKGLGKDETGITEAIAVKKKEDTAGVGSSDRWDWTDMWWEGAYNSAVRSVQAEVENDSTASDLSSDDETTAFERQTQIQLVAINRDGTRATASATELEIAAQLAKDPWGRFGGREGKLARIRRQEQEALQLAAGVLPTQVATNASSAAQHTTPMLPAEGRAASAKDKSAEAVAVASGPASEVAKVAKRAKKRKQGAGATVHAAVGGPAKTTDTTDACTQLDAATTPSKKRRKAAAASCLATSKSQTLAEEPDPQQGQPEGPLPAAHAVHAVASPQTNKNWWGAKMHRSAGCLEGMSRPPQAAEPPAPGQAVSRADSQLDPRGGPGLQQEGLLPSAAATRRQFSESDQEALYMRTWDKKTANKKGLGQSGNMKGVQGWKGSRIEFAEAAQQPAPQKERQAELVEPQPGAKSMLARPAANPPGKKIKWKQMAAAVLEQVSQQQMPRKALQKQLLATAQAKYGGHIDMQQVKAAVSVKVLGSSKFLLNGKIVRMT